MGKIKKNIWKWLLVILTIFLRFYNLGISSRLIWDESSDLVRMKDLLTRPRLTMIGPISEGGGKVFGSLTYYLTLPFVYIFKFDPVSSAYATAFFGCLTVFIGFFVVKKLNISRWILVLMVVSFPLLEAARWAWNPHFIPFWEIFSVSSFLLSNGWGYFFAGLFLGLTVHHHYYGFFVVVGLVLMSLFVKNNRLKRTGLITSGVVTALLPFAIFDITHPPGLFITRLIYFSPLTPTGGAFNLTNILVNWIKVPLQFFSYLNGNIYLAGIITLGLTLISVFKAQKRAWLIPIVVHLFCLSLIGGGIFNHYLLPAVIFYYLWLGINLKNGKVFGFILALIIITNIWVIPKVLFQNDWSTNINATKEITEIMKAKYALDKSNFNIAVLGSPDPNTKGLRYRDLLSLENIPIASIDDYSKINRVFYISYNSWPDLTKDPAYELNSFRQLEPIESWKINNSRWKVYLLQK